MKKVGKAALISIIAVCLLALALGAGKNPESRYTIDTPYEYPILPGTQEWIDLENVVDRRKVCQIPDEILYNMTTDALLETVIDYPFRSDMYAFNDFQTGYETVKRRFNGLQELERRPDCLDALLRYSQVAYASDDAETAWEHHIADSIYYAIFGESDMPSSP
ncbi:MAG: hypothetical protein HFF55_08720 [Lawsonibacter sp.]|nr:hypothetical protein [Lawsonibacter sp.]